MEPVGVGNVRNGLFQTYISVKSKRSNVFIIVAIMLAGNRLILFSMYHPAPPIFIRALICQGKEDISASHRAVYPSLYV